MSIKELEVNGHKVSIEKNIIRVDDGTAGMDTLIGTIRYLIDEGLIDDLEWLAANSYI